MIPIGAPVAPENARTAPRAKATGTGGPLGLVSGVAVAKSENPSPSRSKPEATDEPKPSEGIGPVKTVDEAARRARIDPDDPGHAHRPAAEPARDDLGDQIAVEVARDGDALPQERVDRRPREEADLRSGRAGEGEHRARSGLRGRRTNPSRPGSRRTRRDRGRLRRHRPRARRSRRRARSRSTRSRCR